MKANYRGFSLIELVIAVAVISILAAIAIPTFAGYMARSKAVAARAELESLKTNYDSAVSAGKSAPALSDLEPPVNSAHCTISLTTSQDGGATVACSLVNPPYPISGGVISLIRSSVGAWACQANASIGTTYAPYGCSVGG